MSPGHNIGAGRLRRFIERIERVEEEIKNLNSDKSEIYKEARGEGFDVKTMRKVVTARKVEPAEREEADAMFDLYWSAINGTGMDDATRVHVHEPKSYAEAKNKNPVANVGEGANGAIAAAPVDPASRDADGADRQQPVVSGFTGEDDGRDVEASGGAAPVITIPDEEPFEPPAFLSKPKTAADYRPHCQKPEACGASGLKHCYTCQKIAEAAETEAA